MTSNMGHKGQAVAGLSAGVWGNLPVKNWAVGLGGQFRLVKADGLDMQDDGAAWADGTTNLGMKSEQGAGSTIVVASDVSKTHNVSVIQLTNDGGDGDDCSLASALPVINIASGAGRWAFEARIHPSSVANNEISTFVGLTATAVAADSTLTATDLTASVLAGFFIDEADGDDLRAVVSDGTGAGVANMNISTDNKYVLGSADFYNIGAVYDGERIKFFVSGIKSGESTAKSVLLHTVSEGESEFPSPSTSANRCYFAMSAEAGVGGSASNLGIEWFAYGQEHVDF